MNAGFNRKQYLTVEKIGLYSRFIIKLLGRRIEVAIRVCL